MAPRYEPVFAGDALPDAPSGVRRPISNGNAMFQVLTKQEHEHELRQPSQGGSSNTNVAQGYAADGYSASPNRGNSSPRDPATVAPEGAPEMFRQPGGRPVTFKRVGDDLDEEDSIIKQMKESGFHDDNVAQELIDQGLTKYHPKSIATRYARIKRMTKEKEYEQLDDELTDWHEGDDDMLKDSVKYHVEKYNREIAKVRDAFYDRVATSLHTQQQGANHKIAFSKYECQRRHEALEVGTAEPELELDANQDERQARREQRFLEIKQTKERKERERVQRMEERAAKEAARKVEMVAEEQRRAERHEAAQLRKTQKMSQKAQANMLTDIFRLKQLAKKDPDLHDQDEKKKIEVMEAVKRADMERRRQIEEELDRKERETENDKKAHEKVRRKEAAAKKRAKKEKNDKALLSVGSIINAEMGRVLGFGSSSEHSDIDSDVLEKRSDKPRQIKTLNVASDTDSSDDEKKLRQGGRKFISTNLLEKKYYSWFPEKNHRGKLPIRALRRLCQLRDIPPVGNRTELVFRLAESDDGASSEELGAMLKARGVSAMGLKNELMNRLALDDAGNLICGSAFYASEVDPRRKHYRSFGSLTPDGTESRLYHNGRRNTAIIIASSSEDEDDDLEQSDMDLDDEEQLGLTSLAPSVEQTNAEDSDISLSD